MKLAINDDEKKILKTAAEELIAWGENEMAKRIGAEYLDEAAGEFRRGELEKTSPQNSITSAALFAATGAGRRLWYRLMNSSEDIVIDEYDVPVISQAIFYAISKERIAARADRYVHIMKATDSGSVITDKERKKWKRKYITDFKPLAKIGFHLAMKLQ
ncbi:MAG: hypothetical protein ABFD62_00765 [Syntrophaceae bacterium]